MWVTYSLIKELFREEKENKKSIDPCSQSKVCVSNVFSSDVFYLYSWTFCL